MFFFYTRKLCLPLLARLCCKSILRGWYYIYIFFKWSCPSSRLSGHLKWLYSVTTQAWVSGQCNPIQATETLLGPVILSVPFHISLQQVSTGGQGCSQWRGMRCCSPYISRKLRLLWLEVAEKHLTWRPQQVFFLQRRAIQIWLWWVSK